MRSPDEEYEACATREWVDVSPLRTPGKPHTRVGRCVDGCLSRVGLGDVFTESLSGRSIATLGPSRQQCRALRIRGVHRVLAH
jgi:hypothetical protein